VKVIITGASKGIGRGIAAYLGAQGCETGLLARSEDALRTVADEVRGRGGAAHHSACDLRDAAATKTAVHRLVEAMNGVDALINNAGLVIRKSVFDISLDEWHAMLETNVNGLFYATRAVLPFMKDQRRGHLINVSSISGRVPLPGGSGYAASKYAVTGFSQSLFQEVRDYGIRVTTLYPGSVDSESHRHGPSEDHSWKTTPEEVGQACHDALRMAPGTVLSEMEIRPLRRPPAP
jgi:3-oxoacyl-[acyl-carrier protein] reductase